LQEYAPVNSISRNAMQWILPAPFPLECTWPHGFSLVDATAANPVQAGAAFKCPGIKAMPPLQSSIQACGSIIVVTARVCSGAVILGMDGSVAAATVPVIRTSADIRGAQAALSMLPDLVNVQLFLSPHASSTEGGETLVSSIPLHIVAAPDATTTAAQAL